MRNLKEVKTSAQKIFYTHLSNNSFRLIFHGFRGFPKEYEIRYKNNKTCLHLRLPSSEEYLTRFYFLLTHEIAHLLEIPKHRLTLTNLGLSFRIRKENKFKRTDFVSQFNSISSLFRELRVFSIQHNIMLLYPEISDFKYYHAIFSNEINFTYLPAVKKFLKYSTDYPELYLFKHKVLKYKHIYRNLLFRN